MTSATHTDVETLRQRFLEAQLAGNRRGAIDLLAAAVRAGARVTDVQLKVVREAQREIGRLWQQNIVSIAQEHMATAIANMALAHLYDMAPHVRQNGRIVLVACVEGELHDFPARLVADALDLAGFDVRYLGANVPTDSLVGMVEHTRPDLVALSATMAFNAPALRTAATRIRERTRGEVPIAVGGAACEWVKGIGEEVGADIAGCDAAELVAEASRLLRVA